MSVRDVFRSRIDAYANVTRHRPPMLVVAPDELVDYASQLPPHTVYFQNRCIPNLLCSGVPMVAFGADGRPIDPMPWFNQERS